MSVAPSFPWEDTRERVYGWKSIAARIGLSKTAAHRYSDPEKWTFPLPAYHSPLGWFAYADELTFWFARWKLPRGAEGALTRRGRKSATRMPARDSVQRRRGKQGSATA